MVLFAGVPARAEMSAEELAKLAQNPVGNLISVPFQNNTNLNYGPEKGTQNILNIQPVVPISVNSEWNVITRTILPVISMPSLGPGIGSLSGVGDTVFTAFLSPAKPGKWIWGAGPVVQIPTNSNSELGNKNWGMGPAFVVLHMDHGDPWVYGALVNNIWSVSSSKQGGSYNNGTLQPFANYNFPGGLYLTTAPDHHGRLERRQQPALDRAAGRWHRQDLPPGQAAGEHAALGLLQRRQARQRAQLANPPAGAVHVPQVRRPSTLKHPMTNTRLLASAALLAAEPRALDSPGRDCADARGHQAGGLRPALPPRPRRNSMPGPWTC